MRVIWDKEDRFMKKALKSFIYRSGLHRLHHRARNRRALTVVSFHRVLDPADARHAGANPNYTVTTEEFERCLAFFAEHYAVVSLDDVRQALAGAALPDNPLLISFDDGWRDNVEYALPILRKFGFPAVLFIATSFVNSPSGFWQEELYDRIARSPLRHDDIWLRLGLSGEAPGVDFAAACIAGLTGLAVEIRNGAIERLPLPDGELPPRMLTAADLACLHEGGFAIAGHGHTHEPLTLCDDAKKELEQSRVTLTGLPFAAAADAMSFPHGRYTMELMRCARIVGFDLLFSSDSRLTPVDMLKARPIMGRAEINMEMLREEAGYPIEESLAFWLFTQPILGDK